MRISWGCAFLWIPYFPFGLLTMVIRIFIYPHALLASMVLFHCATLKRSVLRVMCVVLGSIVWISGGEQLQKGRKRLPIVSNHISLFDHLMLCLSQDCVTPHADVFHWFSTFVDIQGESVSNLVEKLPQRDMTSVHLLPERRPAEVQERMLKFDPTFFEYLEKVQPVALQVYRPIPIKLVVYPHNWFTELLWHLFVPFTVYYITYLDPMSRLPNECSADFAERVRKAIAMVVGATLQEVDSYKANKEPIVDEKSETPSSNSISPIATPSSPIILTPQSDISESSGLRFRSTHSEGLCSPITTTGEQADVFDHLVQVVQGVLHLTPIQQIREALLSTDGDVDAAIDMLATSQCENASTQETDSLLPVSRINLAAETFHSTSKARQSSLIERRSKLIEHARQRFITHYPKIS